MQEHRIKVWDLPTRLFHWLLVISVALAFATGLQGGSAMVWHGRIGLSILGLLVFRLIWGIIGSTYARFGQFVRGPTAIRAYLQGRWHELGHNPLGALSVLALLGLLLFQAGSGLFATDEIAFSGPLKSLVSQHTSIWLSGLHRQAIWLIGGLIGLHIGAALFYLARGQNLIRPMITGYVLSREPMARPAEGGGILALLLALAIAGGCVWIANGSLLPPPPPPVTPVW
ncbi:cytochrome B [Caldichromatium japonicum]|uniref:Cytochrome B n=1 Tax=Caldichromatium japonicum TaxID=2699430 RepID=A0A6G7VFY9_9GAMM|nr:cytochrome b/b6 domain-containing protein [Caldichromatium japonicum]QIK38785.1 cytochrome B [Caldichromatium japonicum]